MDRVVANRKTTKQIAVGDVHVGGKSPISIQSMTNTNTEDIDATVKQINEIHAACGMNLINLLYSGINIFGICIGHRLNADRTLASNMNIPNSYLLSCFSVRNNPIHLRA